MRFPNFCTNLLRTKHVDEGFMDTKLKRCLSTLDITLLGVGHMIGAGIYVLTGEVASLYAGPGVIVSYLIAGFASFLAALCYAEFGARVPKAGSAYTYAYVTVGELWAFIIGWNIILEHMVGGAAVARSWSGYLDSLTGGRIMNGTISEIGPYWKSFGVLGQYPDFVAFGVVLFFCCFMGYGAKSSSNINAVFTAINLLVIVFISTYGFYFADIENWIGSKDDSLLPNATTGSTFFPFGVNGVMKGAAACFFAYIGFDSIATAGEEAANPGRSIPLATFISMSLVATCYVLVSSALTLMVPYFQIDHTAAFANAFEQRGAVWAKYVVSAGAISGMTTSLIGSLFALPRCIYAMATDGLLFRFLAKVNGKTQTPIIAVVIFGFLTAVIALLFDLAALVEFMSIGTLLAYTIVSSSVIILRYQPANKELFVRKRSSITGTKLNPEAQLMLIQNAESMANCFIDNSMADVHATTKPFNVGMAGTLKPKFWFLRRILPDAKPGVVVCIAVLVQGTAMMCFGAVLSHGHLDKGTWYAIVTIIPFSIIIVASYFVIIAHEDSRTMLRFKVPLVPFLPCLSNFINIVLMTRLAGITWLRLAVWLGIGFVIYFGYGIRHSSENVEEMDEISKAPSVESLPAVAQPMDHRRLSHGKKYEPLLIHTTTLNAD